MRIARAVRFLWVSMMVKRRKVHPIFGFFRSIDLDGFNKYLFRLG